jgi:secreted Zn-dependent insulinase-like peptidase
MVNININDFNINIKLAINDKRNIKGIILKNGIKVVLVSDSKINKSACCVGVKAGHYDDEFAGCAHFLEHLLFMGSEKYPDSRDFSSYLEKYGGIHNAFTSNYNTCYYIELDSIFLEKGVDILSWFFRKPILDMKYIKSEMEIIDSEHKKNILADNWIIDDLLKKFIKNKNSKYAKFGTGNLDSLKDITKEDIMKFYGKHYKTDNYYVCIVDSISMDKMIKKYIPYFNDIEPKLKKELNIPNEKLNLLNNNLIIFKSISEHSFLDIFFIMDCNESNNTDLQLIKFISYLIGSEYEESLSFYLKEKNLIKYLYSSVNYLLDVEGIINIKILLYENDKDIFFKTMDIFCVFLDKLINIEKKTFKNLYNNYQSIKLIDFLYHDKSSSSNICINTVENMISANINDAIIRNYKIEDYNDDLYKKFKKNIKNYKLKFITNVNFNIDKINFSKSKYYNTDYFISDIEKIRKKYNSQNIKKDKLYFDFNKSILIKDFEVKYDLLYKIFNKNEIPKLFFKDDKKEVYVLHTNKYEKPFCQVFIIKKNNDYFNAQNRILLSIYNTFLEKVINYYTSIMADYKCYFSISFTKEYIIYNYNCLNYLLINFINDINKFINNIFTDNNEKYFKNVIDELIEIYNNKKYLSPTQLVGMYLNILIDNYEKPNEILEYLKNINYTIFKEKIQSLLKYSKEYILFFGNFNIENDNKQTEKYFNNIVDIISTNETLYKNDDSIKYPKGKISNYILKKDEYNPKEINNCLYECYAIKKIKINFIKNQIVLADIKKKIKYQFISSIIASIINEPLFDRLRTTDKLGYIVKCSYNTYMYNDYFYFYLIYIVQSTFDIIKIKECIKNFNNFFIDDFNKNTNMYQEKFLSIKKSKLLYYSKDYISLNDETNYYISSIIKNYNIFNLKKLSYKIINNLTFNDIKKYINNTIGNEIDNYNILIDINNK